jgi:signal transduction histidine kinase
MIYIWRTMSNQGAILRERPNRVLQAFAQPPSSDGKAEGDQGVAETISDMANDPGPAPRAPAEPQRTADIARLDLTRLRIEDGVKLDTVFERVTETAADILNVERVGVWLMVDHRRALRCINLYERSKKSHSAGVALTSDLMAFARPGPRSVRILCPAEVIDAQFPILQAAAGERHPLTIDTRSAAGRVLIAPDLLERLMLNLVVNARDAMPDGGSIALVLDEVDDRGEDGKADRFVLIAVGDSGTGIAADLLGKIFDPLLHHQAAGPGDRAGPGGGQPDRRQRRRVHPRGDRRRAGQHLPGAPAAGQQLRSTAPRRHRSTAGAAVGPAVCLA